MAPPTRLMSKTCPVCATVYPDSDAFCPKDGTTLRLDEGASSLVGSVIADRYLVSKLLGEGGMGQVYLAGHVRLPQQAAIKVLHSSMVKDPGAVARFNREAANAARIEHERVARVFDFGETTEGLVYLAMEFVPGKTLRDILDEGGALPAARVANLVYQIAEGLDAAHRISIVHRDLKPDNVLVITDEQGVDRCKVVDFGIAKAFDDSESRKTQLTQAGAIIGTPEFMSPEQVLGEQLDARSDVYALAVVAFNLFTGELPFSATTPERSLTARLISDPQTLHDVAPQVPWPAPLQQAFDSALAREPNERTATALEFGEAVVAAVEGWTGTPVLRGRTPMSTSALTTPGIAKGTGTAGARTQTAPAGGVPILQETARRSPVPMILGAVAVVAAIGFLVMRPGSEAESGAVAAPSVASAAADSSSDTSPPADAARRPEPPTENGVASADAPAVAPPPAATETRTPETRTPVATRETAGTTGQSAGGQGGGTQGAAGNPVGAVAGGGTAASDAEAQRDLEAIQRDLRQADPAITAAVIPQLERLLGRFSTGTDSAWVYVNLAQAYVLTENAPRACIALRSAKRLATSDRQLQAVQGLVGSGFFNDCLF
jgi:eukaryotic-like serine/threonine-protein kinase